MVGPFGLKPKGTMSVRALPLAKALAARDHEVNMIMPAWHTPEESGKQWIEEGVGLRNITLPARLPGLWHLLVARRMVGRVLDLRPDVVHCFKPKAYSGLVAAGLLQLRRVGRYLGRIVVDTDDWEGKGGWNELEPYSAAERAFFAWQERWGLRHADAVTVASRTLETLVWSLGVARRDTSYLPNGCVEGQSVAGDRLRIRDRHELRDLPVVLLYTRFFEFRHERVVAMFRKVVDQVAAVRLLVVGRGLFGEEKEFLELARASGLEDSVVYAGWVSPDELGSYFACADVAVYPYDDTLVNRAKCSVKLVELLAAGVPVVADRVGQNLEYIEDGVSGLLPRDGEEAFVAAVVRMLRDERLRRRLGLCAQERMRDHFAWPRLAEIAERVYAE